MDIDTGITSEVLTIKSKTKLIDIFNKIINEKSNAVFNYINKLDIRKDAKIVVIGTYFTGIGIVKKLSEEYENILLIDIYQHLKELLDTQIEIVKVGDLLETYKTQFIIKKNNYVIKGIKMTVPTASSKQYKNFSSNLS